MNPNDDWRLTGQERYLKNVKLRWSRYAPPSETWDHDHCSFCWERFSNSEVSLREGYCTLDEYHWICKKCFEDFKCMFSWIMDT